MVTPPFLWAAAGLVFGVLVGFLVSRSRARALYELEKAESKDEASRILDRAQEEAESVVEDGQTLIDDLHRLIDGLDSLEHIVEQAMEIEYGADDLGVPN